MASRTTKVEYTSRQIIQNKLLCALDERDDCVAALLTKEDLEVIHVCLCGYEIADTQWQDGVKTLNWSKFEERRRDLARDLKLLLDRAFPNK